jgi:putative FmdB family regulatory protein
MPLFEYVCDQCGTEFEALVQGARVVECPQCEGKSLERKLSGFAVLGSAPAPRCNGEAACAASCDGRGPARCPLS